MSAIEVILAALEKLGAGPGFSFVRHPTGVVKVKAVIDGRLVILIVKP